MGDIYLHSVPAISAGLWDVCWKIPINRLWKRLEDRCCDFDGPKVRVTHFKSVHASGRGVRSASSSKSHSTRREVGHLYILENLKKGRGRGYRPGSLLTSTNTVEG